MSSYIVRGRYTPTDFSYFTDQPDLPYSDEVTEVECDSLAEAEAMLLWYPGGEIVEQSDE